MDLQRQIYILKKHSISYFSYLDLQNGWFLEFFDFSVARSAENLDFLCGIWCGIGEFGVGFGVG